MRYVVLVGIAIFLSTGQSSASATELDNGIGMMAPGSKLHAVNGEPLVFSTPIGNLICLESTFEASTSTTGSSSETVTASVSVWTFAQCNGSVTVSKTGSLEFHTADLTANNNGTLTSTDLTFTVALSGFHCIYRTFESDMGTITGSTNTKSTASVDLEAEIVREGGRSGTFCGSSGRLSSAPYVFTTPDTLNVT